MKNNILSIIIISTVSLYGGLAQAEDAEPKINQSQLKEQIRNVTRTEANENAGFMKTEHQQNRIRETRQNGATEKLMEQNRYQHQQRKQYQQKMDSSYDTNRSSRYGQGFESRTNLHTGARSNHTTGARRGR